MKNAHSKAGASVIPAKGSATPFVVAKKNAAQASCFGDEETLSAASSVRGQF
jgi:hypothetical protein